MLVCIIDAVAYGALCRWLFRLWGSRSAAPTLAFVCALLVFAAAGVGMSEFSDCDSTLVTILKGLFFYPLFGLAVFALSLAAIYLIAHLFAAINIILILIVLIILMMMLPIVPW